MIYDVKKFKHYILGNSFIFFMDHQALLYLVNKPIVIGQIARWLLLLQEFDYKIIFKPERVHFLPDQLSIINHGELAIRVEVQLPDAQLFGIEIDWYASQQIIDYLKKGYFNNDMPKEKQNRLVIKARSYTSCDGHLHKLRPDGMLRQCLTPI
jgi:hypothetical protein